jgi:hypothetical protein
MKGQVQDISGSRSNDEFEGSSNLSAIMRGFRGENRDSLP